MVITSMHIPQTVLDLLDETRKIVWRQTIRNVHLAQNCAKCADAIETMASTL